MWVNIGDSYAATSKNRTIEQATNNSNIQGSLAGQSIILKQRNKIVSGLKPKDMVGVPWMLAFALRSAGWYLRQDIIWNKPNPMPESVSDRCTKVHEYVFLLSKSVNYYYDQAAILEPMAASSFTRLNQVIENQNGSNRAHGGQKHNGPMKACQPKGNRKTFRGGGKYTNNQSFDNSEVATNDSIGNIANGTGLRKKRSVWTVATQPYSEAHFATFPEDLIVPCIKAGCPEGGIILDCFMGAGTTALVARKLNRNFIGFELNPEYINIAENRLKKELGMFQ
jgi:DNA modification methylase